MSPNLPLGRMIRVVAVLLATAVAAPGVVSASVNPSVITSSREELRFGLELPDVTWRTGVAADPAETVWDATLPGFAVSGKPGGVRLPRAGGWLVVPPGTVPRLEVVREDWQPLDGRALAVAPIPVWRGDAERDELSETWVFPQPGEPLPADLVDEAVLEDMRRTDPAVQAGPAVRLGETAWWRGRRIVAYTVYPVRADADGRAQQRLTGGDWRIRFVADAATKTMPDGVSRRLRGKGDERFAGVFLNGDMMKNMVTEAAHLGVRADKAAPPRAKGTPLGYPEVRVAVRSTGLYRVQAGEMIDDGLLPGTSIQENQIRLYQRRYAPQLDDPSNDAAVPYVEIEVPIRMVGGGDAFDGDDLFLFWGLRLRDDGPVEAEIDGAPVTLEGARDSFEIDNVDNIYWLQFADADPGESWARMTETGLPGADGVTATTYTRTDYWNEQSVYRENVPEITMDRYYYNSQNDHEASVGLLFWSPVETQVDAVVRAGLSGFSADRRTLLVDLVAGGATVATLPNAVVNTRTDIEYQAVLPAEALVTERLALRVRNSITSIGLFSFLNWAEVEYEARYAAPTDRLLFPGPEGQTVANIEITDLTTDDAVLVEVTDPRHPTFVNLSRSNLLADGEGYKLSLQIDQNAGRRRFYLASRITGVGVVDINYGNASLASDPVVPTRLDESSADVLVVAHPDFREGAQEWIDYRKQRAGSEGLTFQMVEPQDLYDWYNGGLRGPIAIKRWVNHALDSATWGSWTLVLVGDANENPRRAGVSGEGMDYSRDWVPSHVHTQDVSGLSPEVLASDDWYGNRDADDLDFPNGTFEPPDMYVGRFPVNSPEEMQRLLNKIQIVENVQPGETWRRRGIFIADDAWSTGSYSTSESYKVEEQSWEWAFETSEAGAMAVDWNDNAGMVALDSTIVLLRRYMQDYYPAAGGSVDLSDARHNCELSGATPGLIATLSQGALLAHYQGHANHWVLAHEDWMLDNRLEGTRRADIADLSNVGKPWVFCGMGCHLGDFIQHVGRYSGTVEPGFGEKLLLWTDAGASAVYASSGYEYLAPNARLSEQLVERMTQLPPSVAVSGETVTSRWMLGELLWAAESDVLATESSYRFMVYQFALLGDPLMVLDAGAPEIEAQLSGTAAGAITEEADLVATDASNLRTITLRARDEAGVDRVEVIDSTGADLTSAAVTSESVLYDNGSRQVVDYELSVPVRPFNHDVVVHVRDSADRLTSDDHTQLTLHVAQEHEVTTAGGEPVDPATFVFTVGEPTPLEINVTSAAWFAEPVAVSVAGSGLTVSDVVVSRLGDHDLRVTFTALAEGDEAERGVDLVIDGYTTSIVLEGDDPVMPGGEISRLVNYPNPMRDDTRFVFATELNGGRGRVRVWTVSGRSVAEVSFALAGGGHEIVSWDGRDREGDRLANGTYLYRVEIESSTGQVRSDMERLVIMR